MVNYQDKFQKSYDFHRPKLEEALYFDLGGFEFIYTPSLEFSYYLRHEDRKLLFNEGLLSSEAFDSCKANTFLNPEIYSNIEAENIVVNSLIQLVVFDSFFPVVGLGNDFDRDKVASLTESLIYSLA